MNGGSSRNWLPTQIAIFCHAFLFLNRMRFCSIFAACEGGWGREAAGGCWLAQAQHSGPTLPAMVVTWPWRWGHACFSLLRKLLLLGRREACEETALLFPWALSCLQVTLGLLPDMSLKAELRLCFLLDSSPHLPAAQVGGSVAPVSSPGNNMGGTLHVTLWSSVLPDARLSPNIQCVLAPHFFFLGHFCWANLHLQHLVKWRICIEMSPFDSAFYI